MGREGKELEGKPGIKLARQGVNELKAYLVNVVLAGAAVREKM